jgi:phage terminase large subunit
MRLLVPNTVAEYNQQLHQMYFVNGSVIKFGHFQSYQAGDAEYRGQEFDWIFIDEATQFTEDEFRLLGGCLRGVNNIPKYFRLSCNPGGVGHYWVKRIFIDRDFKTDSENPEENEDPRDYDFIFARVEDNTAYMHSKDGKEYLKMLSQLPESIREAHRRGNWDAIGGNYFPEFTVANHTCKPFAIPAHWKRYRAFDYGLDMFACLWIAVDESGRSYVYREYQKDNLIVSDAAEQAIQNTGISEKITATFAPPDMWNRQKDSGKSMAELFMLNGLPIIKANNNRVQGWLQVKEFLKPMGDGKPALVIFDTCNGLIESLREIQADETNPNDCAKEPHKITHISDALRYYCISRTMPTLAPTEEYARDEFDDYEEDYEDAMTGGDATASYIAY